MNDWFWLKINLLSSPKCAKINKVTDSLKIGNDHYQVQDQFPKLYAITKVLMANKILFNGLEAIKTERRYRAKVLSSYHSQYDEIIAIEKEALTLYKEAAFLGCPIAFAIIGYYHENGLAGLPVNYYKAEHYYTLGLDNLHINHKKSSPAGLSLIRLSFLKQYGRPGIIINQCLSKKYKRQAKSLGPNVTLNWVETLANLEHVSSLFILASSYYNGLGVEKNVEKAYHYAKIAAEYGHSGAQNLVGMIYYEGTETLEKSEEMALKWYRKAAKANEAAALYNLAMLYENGVVVLQNYNEAFQYYKMASDFGSISGTNIIGFLSEHGIGTERNKVAAFKYYCKAATKGSPFGQYNLGRCFLYGIGIEKNIPHAIKWFELAGLQGHGNSYLTLAILYDMGIRVGRNVRLARRYYTLAYRNNVKATSKRLKAGIAFDVLRAARYVLRSSSSSTSSAFSSLPKTLCQSNDTLCNSYSSSQEDLMTMSTNSLSNNPFMNIFLNISNPNISNNNKNELTNENFNNNNINHSYSSHSISKSTTTTNSTTTNIAVEEDSSLQTACASYNSSYLTMASSSMETLNIPTEEESMDQDMMETNSSTFSSSLDISEIMEYIHDFDSPEPVKVTKKNYLASLPLELKYYIINMNNIDGILPPEAVQKIYKYVLEGSEKPFQTKDEFLNYLNIKEFKLEEKMDQSYRNTEERVNNLIDLIHKE